MQAMPRQIWNHDQIGHENEVLGVRLGHGTGDQYFAGDAPSQYGTDGDTHGGDVLLGYGTDIEPVMEMGFWVPQRGFLNATQRTTFPKITRLPAASLRLKFRAR